MTGDPGSRHGRNLAEGPWEMTGLVDDNLRPLFAYAYRLTGSINEAEDLTQQTFLVAQQKIGQLREVSKVRPWLLAVLRNCFLRSQRRRRPVAASQLEIDVDQIVESLSANSDWDLELLQLALRELSDEFRTVVLMFYFEQLSYKEIAAQLDLPIGTVMSRLSRAKTCLRSRLAGASSQSAPAIGTRVAHGG